MAEDAQTTLDNSKTDMKDQNVYSFMMQLVQEKHGDDVDAAFLADEAEILYEIFGDMLLIYFEPQLKEEQKRQFDEMVEMNSDQDDLLSFLIENISDLEDQIVNLLVKFRTDYLSGKMEEQGAAEKTLHNQGV